MCVCVRVSVCSSEFLNAAILGICLKVFAFRATGKLYASIYRLCAVLAVCVSEFGICELMFFFLRTNSTNNFFFKAQRSK